MANSSPVWVEKIALTSGIELPWIDALPPLPPDPLPPDPPPPPSDWFFNEIAKDDTNPKVEVGTLECFVVTLVVVEEVALDILVVCCLSAQKLNPAKSTFYMQLVTLIFLYNEY